MGLTSGTGKKIEVTNPFANSLSIYTSNWILISDAEGSLA